MSLCAMSLFFRARLYCPSRAEYGQRTRHVDSTGISGQFLQRDSNSGGSWLPQEEACLDRQNRTLEGHVHHGNLHSYRAA